MTDTILNRDAGAAVASPNLPEASFNVAVVIIGRNEGERLIRCFESVLKQTSPESIVYVDSGSTDASVREAEQRGIAVKTLDRAIPFTAARARNEGMHHLLSCCPDLDAIQFLDGDCQLQPGWIGHAKMRLSRDESLAVVCGRRREIRPKASVWNQMIDCEWETPIGAARSCGGDAMFRVSALRQAGGYTDEMIAGEEPELCVRLRSKGWRVWRLDHEMTLHDADLVHFAQWWKRSKRYGHAAAEGYARHGSGDERFMAKQVRGILFWGGGIWLLSIAISILSWPYGLAIWIWIPAEIGRQALRFVSAGSDQRLALRRATVQLACKPAELFGMAQYYANRIRGRSSTLMEYKSGDSRPIVYFAARYPEVSETFVWREVQSLKRHGNSVLVVALRSAIRVAKEVPKADFVVYEQSVFKIAASVSFDLLRHPLRGFRVLIRAIGDALVPGEQMSLRARVKCVVQAIVAIAVARRLSSYNPRHLHSHFAHSPSSVAMYCAMQLDRSWSFTGHANDLFQRRHLLRRKLDRADAVVCISHWHRDFYRREMPGTGSKLRVVRCGVELSDDHANSLFEHDPVRVLSVGRLVAKKGFASLIEAFARVRAESDRDIQLTIVGDGPESNRLVELASKLYCRDAVHFPGALDHEGVKQAMREADVFVLACREDGKGDRDGIPVVLMEAMAAGLPTISGDLPTIRELICDGMNGRLVDATDAIELGDAIRQTIDRPSDSTAMGRRARQTIKAEFCTEQNIKRLSESIGVSFCR